jgi:hypothetical protein
VSKALEVYRKRLRASDTQQSQTATTIANPPPPQTQKSVIDRIEIIDSEEERVDTKSGEAWPKLLGSIQTAVAVRQTDVIGAVIPTGIQTFFLSFTAVCPRCFVFCRYYGCRYTTSLTKLINLT